MTKVAVTAVERVLDIVEAFRSARRPLSLTELAELIGTPKSSCHAIVGTMVARGYLYTLSRPRALYPTRRLHDLSREILQFDPFLERAVPLLEKLRDDSQETVIFGKRQADAVVYLQVVPGPHSIRYSASPGEIKPLHSSAIGKSILGSLRDGELQTLLKELPLPAITGATLADRHALLEDIARSRMRGYYVTRGENVADVWAVAASLVVDGETLAIAVAGPRHRMETSLQECARLLVSTCSMLGRQAGTSAAAAPAPDFSAGGRPAG
jgi:DNA-binding IclR family transcriptional regulator